MQCLRTIISYNKEIVNSISLTLQVFQDELRKCQGKWVADNVEDGQMQKKKGKRVDTSDHDVMMNTQAIQQGPMTLENKLQFLSQEWNVIIGLKFLGYL